MKHLSPHQIAAVLGLLSMGAGAVMAAQTPSGQPGKSTPAQGQERYQTQPGVERESQKPLSEGRTLSTQTGQPQNVNKASNLIGMIVRNQAGEPLGAIKEIVVDIKAGSVSYAVLATQGNGLQGKMHAVPLYAFQPSQDGNSVTLQADKATLDQAQGFGPTEWPSVNHPSWGAEPFWQQQANPTDKSRFPDATRPGIDDPTRPGIQERGRPGVKDPDRPSIQNPTPQKQPSSP